MIDISGLTLNAEEARAVSEFIVTMLEKEPALSRVFELQTGVKMKQQIVLVKSLGKVGVLASGCDVVTSGATTTATQKFWEPANIEDTLTFCQADVNALWKPYFALITEYQQRYNAEGSEELVFIAALVLGALSKAITRAAYFGNKNVAVSGAAASGLVAAADVKFYNYFDGLFKQAFAAVTAGTLTRVTISENAAATKAAQTTLAAGRAKAILDEIWAKASTDLRADMTARFEVGREIFDNLEAYFIDHGVKYDIQIGMDALPTMRYRGREVVNMESVWDGQSREDFEATNAHAAYYAPLRVLFTPLWNKPIATLSADDLANLEVWYNRDEKKMKIRFGFTLDAKLLDENMAVIAY